MYWMLAKLVPVRLIASIALLAIGLQYAGVDLVAMGLDLLGIPDWSWSALKFW
ncbi:hypothetical protein [Halobellus clavatus]|jgi:hypothetical protein|uniref:Uncharacterized protein n=1 Tax=Halobellus clavatus TaxID=660517 RepID=A0A1H3KIE4_9EURY|nr:hypothetical protein [Halobellus clavatus]SDY51364.1 hypothetical protein SAMN04487946_11950 [Halobellus clavatus]